MGDVSGWVHDLTAAWQGERDRQRTYVSSDDAVWTSHGVVSDVPASVLWEWMTTPARKLQWETGFDDIVEELPDGGRRGPGAQTHCMHGENVISNRVLDWRPPHYLTNYGEFPDGTPYVVTDEVTVNADGDVTVRKSMRAATEETQEQLEQMLTQMAPLMDTWIPTLIELATAEHAARPPTREPSIPDSTGRWRTGGLASDHGTSPPSI